MCEFIRAAGGECDVVDWHGQPLAIGELKASHGGPAPTVLCYGHFDVQPPDPLELWESEPFAPEIRGDYLYGRGTVDDKGQLYVLLAAARDLARAGELPVNVRFCCDGEEETGGHSIVEFLEADERGADAAVIFDGGMIRRDLPAFNVATRGVVYFHLTLRTGDRDLHSGVFGGAALNAAHALIATLGGLIAHDGTLADSLRQVGCAHRGGARRLGRVAGRRGRARRAGRAPEGRAGRCRLLPAHLRGAGARRERHRERLAAAAEDRSARRGDGERLDQACARPGGRRDRARGRAPPARVRAARSRSDDRALVGGGTGLVPPDAKAIQLGLDAFERALGRAPRSFAPAARCRSSRRSAPRASPR